MRKKNIAAAEIIGAILLTGIIVAAIGIFGYQWFTKIPLSSPVHANLEIACGNTISPYDFNCRSGVIGCSQDENLPYGFCVNNCSNLSLENQRDCMKNCESIAYCADTNACNNIFICHNGGDSLEISRLNISINDEDQYDNSGFWLLDGNKNNSRQITAGNFSTSNVLCLSVSNPPKSVKIIYQNDQTGEKNILINKIFR